MRELNEAIDHAVEAFRETKEATAETVAVNGIITAGALAAAPLYRRHQPGASHQARQVAWQTQRSHGSNANGNIARTAC
ncbi:MAG: hypothetical protein R3D26_10745 [Cyanobacteriota/Melainabacteria group bacterium]